MSRGTVSRVLNGGHDVSAAALDAVQRAIQQTGYVVNQHARSLVTQRANSVAFILSEPQERLFEDPNFTVLLRGATQALAEHDISLFLMIAGTTERPGPRARLPARGHVDGALLVSTHAGDPLLAALARGPGARSSPAAPARVRRRVPYVAADDRGGGQQMTQYLVDLGRKRIAHDHRSAGHLRRRRAAAGLPRRARGAVLPSAGSPTPRSTPTLPARSRWSSCSSSRPTSTRCSSPRT